VRLNVHRWGEGPPLVCLHGISGHGRRFIHLANRLSDRTVIAPDLRGHGSSGKEPPWDIGTHVLDLLETIDEPFADWLGFSFGGRVAAQMAAQYPERVRSLILLDAALQFPADLALKRADGARATESYDGFEAAVKGQKDPDDPYETPREHLAEEVRENFVHEDGVYTARWEPAAVVVGFSELARPAPPPTDHPTTSVVGDRSWVPRAERGEVVELRSGHGVLWDAFDETAAAVERHLHRRP
jgi:lipase